MKVSVGSKNPVKIAAVENVVKKVWPDAEVVAIEVPSGVSVQPGSNEEAIKGATNRARRSMEQTEADIGIGIEGNTHESDFGMFTSAWAVAVGKNEKIGIGSAGSLLLPEKVAEKIREGGELGPVMDELTGDHNTKQKQGAVGILTNDLVTRTSSLEKAVAYALSRFISPNHYE